MSRILSSAHHLPAAADVGGVKRPIAAEPGGPSDLVLEPARAALREAGLADDGPDLIVFATMTPDVTFPGSACWLQKKLGCRTVGALDIRGQCTGFLMSLMIADGFLETGQVGNVLLAAAEVHSSGLDYSERGMPVARLYGDGAAAVVLEPAADSAGPYAVVCHSDGRYYDRFWCEYPASRHHPTRIEMEQFRAGLHFPRIDFDTVAEFGRRHLPAVVREALAQAGVPLESVDYFVFSHALPEVVEDSVRSLGLPAERACDAGAAHGHLTAATLPLALDEALRDGRVERGARVCLAACGAGFTWGAALMTV